MSPLLRGVLVATIQVALMGVVGAKLLYDRATLPRAWMETAGVDPDLPIRGRYVSLNLVLPAAPESPVDADSRVTCGRIALRDGKAVAVLAEGRVVVATSLHPVCFRRRAGQADGGWQLVEPVAFFLPEHAADPTRGVRPGELWVEVTLPPRGGPRPIRLGLRRDGLIEPAS